MNTERTATTPSRRALLRTGAWAAPAVSLASAAPAYARSGSGSTNNLVVTQTSWSRENSRIGPAGWIGPLGNGQPGTPGGYVSVSRGQNAAATGFYSESVPTSTHPAITTATWSVNLTALVPYTVSARLHAPMLVDANPNTTVGQHVGLTINMGPNPQLIGGGEQVVGVAPIVPLPGGSAILPGGTITLGRTFTPHATGLWTIVATFTANNAVSTVLATHPFALETPSVVRSA